MTRHHLRNEMDSISEEYCVDRSDLGSAQSEPVVSVAAWSSATAAARRSRGGRGHRCPGATGAIFAFLGPNGAGKTTTIEILSWVTIACSHRPFLVRGSPVRLS
jgi:flagellar biosynthesis GTPase FlhF